jgi:phosphoribosyl-ATP pyrophosphohydrolase
MGYHEIKIAKGELGEFSKIREEFEELNDAMIQGNKLMAICECADIIGAIEAFVAKYNLSLKDLIRMSDATKSAFADGSRK